VLTPAVHFAVDGLTACAGLVAVEINADRKGPDHSDLAAAGNLKLVMIDPGL
jgi:hypothetical protein